MQFFVLGHDRAGGGELRRSLLQPHWDFMSRYAEAMIARGPTMGADGKSVTGSMHIVELPDAETAQGFAHEDPLAIGGVFASIAVRRFENLAGRTMWQFAGDGTKKRFLFVGERDAATPAPVKAAISAQGDWLGHGEHAANMIVFGSLLGTDGATWEGTVMLLEAADLAEAQAIPAADPLAGHYTRRALHPWRFGGQENLKDLLASR